MLSGRVVQSGIGYIPVPVYLACTRMDVSIDVGQEPLKTHSVLAACLRYILTRMTVESTSDSERNDKNASLTMVAFANFTQVALPSQLGHVHQYQPRKHYLSEHKQDHSMH